MGLLETVRQRPAPDDAPPPPRPAFFDSRYELPKHRIKLLETLHPHERDAKIAFYEEPHIYTIDGQPTQLSVSGIAHEFQKPFDAHAVIAGMQKTQREAWPRLKYVRGARKVASVDELQGSCLIYDPDTERTVASLVLGGDAQSESGIVTYTLLDEQRIQQHEAKSDREEWYVFERAMTDAEILEAWELNGEDARNRGTEAHLMMELWLNSEAVREDDAEVVVGLDFLERCLAPIQAKAYRTEWTIFGEEENVAGCIDAAFVMPDGALFLVDWKRSEKLPTKMHGFSKMRGALKHLDDCDGCAYALQLSLYQYIIEKYYGKRVCGRALASIHPTQPFTTATPYLAAEAEYLMALCRAKTDARVRAAATHPHLCCSLDRRLVMTGVRDASGALFEKKNALLADLKTVPDEAATAEAAKLVDELAPAVAAPKHLPSWQSIFKPTEDMLHY